jgi:hypothetical protein
VSAQRGKLQIVFGECELSVGEATENDYAIEQAAIPAAVVALEAVAIAAMPEPVVIPEPAAVPAPVVERPGIAVPAAFRYCLPSRPLSAACRRRRVKFGSAGG